MTATANPSPEPTADELARVTLYAGKGRGSRRLQRLTFEKRTEEIHDEVCRRECVTAVDEELTWEFLLTGGLAL